jgi:hypothetical protein
MSDRRAFSTRIALAMALASVGFREALAEELAPPHGTDSPEDKPARIMGREASVVAIENALFGPDPAYEGEIYDVSAQLAIYGGKRAIDAPRPLLEVGRALYGAGPLGEGYALFGDKNRFFPQAILFGDWRTAVATNDLGDDRLASVATQLNLNLDLKLTGTERIHLFWKPLENGAKITRAEIDRSDGAEPKSVVIFNPEPVTAFFEGDLGAMYSNFTNDHAAFDAPVAFGRMPLLFQNGVWLEDAMLGLAATIPARHIRSLDVSNLDITIFAAFDEVTTPALRNSRGGIADHAGQLYGVKGFFDTRQGYLEAGFARIADRRDGPTDFSYNNLSVAFSRRYGGWLSNSLRIIANFGQDPGAGARQTADGWLLLVENSLVTHKPSTLIPYANAWYGSDRPQSVARAGAAGGVLRNTGLAFESDFMTGFPTLDDTAADSYGGAVGLQYLFNLDRQIVVEAAGLGVHGDRADRPARGAQAAVSVRAQQPLTKRWILRGDAIWGVRQRDSDISGLRVELRCKF